MVKPCIKCGARDRNKRGNCTPCAQLAKITYQKNNPEKIKLANAKWQKANLKKRLETMSNWKKAHPEKMKSYTSKWRRANQNKVNIYNHNRRTKKRTNGGKLSSNLAEILYKRQRGKCVCCNEPLGKDYHLDHIMPLSLGGKNEDWNMQLLRARCNLQKNAKHPIEYMQSKGLLL